VQTGSTDVSGPIPKSYLAALLYSLTHFDSSQSDSTPYGPPKGVFTIDLKTLPIVYKSFLMSDDGRTTSTSRPFERIIVRSGYNCKGVWGGGLDIFFIGSI